MSVTATQEKGGLERLRDREGINKFWYQELMDEETRGGHFELLPFIEALDGIAGFLCDLLDWRDKMEGEMDNPPEIPDAN